MAMVVDLGPFPRLVTIKGNFDAKKGSEAGYVGAAGDLSFPAPQVELSDALEKAKDILQILAALQGGDYVEAFRRGMRVAMSNGADSWEYKFEASQEIPVLKFPPGPLANDPNAPLKLEASLKLGVYFNAALTTAALSDPKKLLPTAGAFVEFYGRLSVMCVSISIATVYAVGQCNLRIAGDTKVGPSLDMKFGFGAQIVVGLPVVGNVSVIYMVGVEIYTDATTINVSAFLLFQGHAELIGGLGERHHHHRGQGHRQAHRRPDLLRSASDVRVGHQHLPGHRHQLQQIMGRAAADRVAPQALSWNRTNDLPSSPSHSSSTATRSASTSCSCRATRTRS